MQEFDFEAWRTLAETDPEAFERQREQALDALIVDAPEGRQQRLRGLQWRVDMERSRHKDPEVSCQKVFGMMWQSVYGEDGLLEALNGLPEEGEVVKAAVLPSRKQAQVLAFQAAD